MKKFIASTIFAFSFAMLFFLLSKVDPNTTAFVILLMLILFLIAFSGAWLIAILNE